MVFMTPDHLRTALGLLTRLPGGRPGPIADAVWSFPLVGALVGALQAALAALALGVGMTPAVAAGLALLAGGVITGGLHEDGLADTADGLWGGTTREKRLAIMRDSRLGSYGALALIATLGLQGAALSALFAQGYIWAPLIVAGAASRAAMGPLMARLPHARTDGLARHAGRATGQSAALGLGLAFAIAVLLSGHGVVGVALSVAAVTAWLSGVAMARLGGQTGDILGATQQLSQNAALLALSASLC